MSNTPSQNLSQMIRDLQNTVSSITLMLTAFDTRVTKLEQRMDKAEEEQKSGKQWANDEHARIRETVNTAERNILAKIDETSGKSWEQRMGHLIAVFGWMIAIGIFLAGYIFTYILHH